jgi:hypothetical protein
MTVQRFDNNSTEFGLWLRGGLRKKLEPAPALWTDELVQQTDVSEIDSMLKFHATNLDYIWRNEHRFILLEEKRFEGVVHDGQHRSFALIHRALVEHYTPAEYGGFFVLRFENTNPEDGKMWLGRFQSNDKAVKEAEITIPDLLRFLKLDWMKKEF